MTPEQIKEWRCRHGWLRGEQCEDCKKIDSLIADLEQEERLTAQLTVTSLWQAGEIARLIDERDALKAAICKTLDDNGHLADGENCTLADLKAAMGDKT